MVACADVTVAMASEAGQLQLNAFGRVVAAALLGSLKWLTAAMVTLRENCVDGISANRERLAQQTSTFVGVITAFTPYIGYAAPPVRRIHVRAEALAPVRTSGRRDRHQGVDTVTRIKTTIDIPDALLEDAKRVATHEGTTLRALVESGLRRELDERTSPRPFTLRVVTVDGNGMRPEFRDGGWEAIRDAIYEGHGA